MYGFGLTRARTHAFDFFRLIAIGARIADALYIDFGVGSVRAIGRVGGAMCGNVLAAGAGATRLRGFAALRCPRHGMGSIRCAAGIHDDLFSPTRVDSLPPV